MVHPQAVIMASHLGGWACSVPVASMVKTVETIAATTKRLRVIFISSALFYSRGKSGPILSEESQHVGRLHRKLTCGSKSRAPRGANHPTRQGACQQKRRIHHVCSGAAAGRKRKG